MSLLPGTVLTESECTHGVSKATGDLNLDQSEYPTLRNVEINWFCDSGSCDKSENITLCVEAHQTEVDSLGECPENQICYQKSGSKTSHGVCECSDVQSTGKLYCSSNLGDQPGKL